MFTLQGAGPFLQWFTLLILFVMPMLGAVLLYKLGSLPGTIAKARNHPQAEAINICGWMGIVTFVLWPIAMVWAHMGPVGPASSHAPAERVDTGSVIEKLQQASRRLAAIEARLPSRPAGRGA